MNFILRFLLSGVILLVLDWLLDSITIASYGTALIAVIMLAVMNVLVKPILHIISLPITIVTLGLFSFVINALAFYAASALVPGFEIASFWGAFIGSIIFSAAQGLLLKKE